VRLHQRHVLVRGGVEDDRGPVPGEHLAQARLVADVGDDGHQLRPVRQPPQALVDLEDAVLAVADQDQLAGLGPGDLAAQLRSDRAAGAGDQYDLVLEVQAGLGLESAVERVAQEMKQSNRPVGVEFSLLTHEMRVYPDRKVALTNLAERTGQPALKRLAGTLAQTLKYGTPLSQGLRTLAAEMRNERMIQFEERAGKLPALLVVPMILFILPCLFIVLMGQPVSQLLGTLGEMAR